MVLKKKYRFILPFILLICMWTGIKMCVYCLPKYTSASEPEATKIPFPNIRTAKQQDFGRLLEGIQNFAAVCAQFHGWWWHFRLSMEENSQAKKKDGDYFIVANTVTYSCMCVCACENGAVNSCFPCPTRLHWPFSSATKPLGSAAWIIHIIKYKILASIFWRTKKRTEHKTDTYLIYVWKWNTSTRFDPNKWNGDEDGTHTY